jgi:hypothetical protein
MRFESVKIRRHNEQQMGKYKFELDEGVDLILAAEIYRRQDVRTTVHRPSRWASH